MDRAEPRSWKSAAGVKDGMEISRQLLCGPRTFSILYFSIASCAVSIAICCMSSDWHSFGISLFPSALK